MNEDAVGATSTAAWVIDGATGVSDAPPLVAGRTDAAWLAGVLNDTLRAAFHSERVDPLSALLQVEADIRGGFAKIKVGRELTAGEQPSAALAVAVSTNGAVHMLGVGDCRIIFETQGGEFGVFDPSDAAAAEHLIIAERNRLIAAYPGEDPWPRLKPFIRSMREFANLEPGYAVVHPTRAWSRRIKQQARAAAELRHLLIASDGLYRLVDVFCALSIEELLQRATTDGLQSLCPQLRGLEHEDADCTRHPRVKIYDDASGVLLSVN